MLDLLHQAPQGDLLQVGQVVNRRRTVLVVLDRQKVVVARLVIHPVVGRNHSVGVQSGDHVVDDLALIESKLGRMDAVDVQTQRRTVHILGNVDVADARQPPDAARKILRHAIGLFQIATGDLQIDGRRHAHIQDGVHHGAALEKRADVGILRRDFVAHAVHVHHAVDAVLRVKRGLDGGRVLPGVGRVEGREVVDDADVGDNHVQVTRVNGVTDQVLDSRDILLRHFDPGSGGRLHVDGELARVRLGKEGDTQERIYAQAGDEQQRQEGDREARPLQCAAHPAFVEIEHAVEHPVKPGVEAAAPGSVFGSGHCFLAMRVVNAL